MLESIIFADASLLSVIPLNVVAPNRVELTALVSGKFLSQHHYQEPLKMRELTLSRITQKRSLHVADEQELVSGINLLI